MINLLTFTPFQPTPGLAIWSLVIFVIFWYIMAKYALKPIAGALAKREEDIQSALDQAKIAKEEMANMKAENEKLLAEATTLSIPDARSTILLSTFASNNTGFSIAIN